MTLRPALNVYYLIYSSKQTYEVHVFIDILQKGKLILREVKSHSGLSKWKSCALHHFSAPSSAIQLCNLITVLIVSFDLVHFVVAPSCHLSPKNVKRSRFLAAHCNLSDCFFDNICFPRLWKLDIFLVSQVVWLCV